MKEDTSKPKQRANRVFEQGPDAISLYSDLAEVINTGHEVVIQFYETIPGPPEGPKGTVQVVKSHLRATITISKAHALNLGNLLLRQPEIDISHPGAQK